MRKKYNNKILIAIFVVSCVLFSIFSFLNLLLKVTTAQDMPETEIPEILPEVILIDECVTHVVLDVAPNGVSGFSFLVNVPVNGTSSSTFIFPETLGMFNTNVIPIQQMEVSGAADVENNIPRGSADILLFSIKPCVTEVNLRQLTDDNGNRILPKGVIKGKR